MGAVLFADISGSTTLAEGLAREMGLQRGAEELTQRLNRIFSGVIDEVHRYGGSVIGFSGDSVTCWFDAGSEEKSAREFLENIPSHRELIKTWQEVGGGTDP
jgi:class 3 adenylate cyclase